MRGLRRRSPNNMWRPKFKSTILLYFCSVAKVCRYRIVHLDKNISFNWPVDGVFQATSKAIFNFNIVERYVPVEQSVSNVFIAMSSNKIDIMYLHHAVIAIYVGEHIHISSISFSIFSHVTWLSLDKSMAIYASHRTNFPLSPPNLVQP